VASKLISGWSNSRMMRVMGQCSPSTSPGAGAAELARRCRQWFQRLVLQEAVQEGRMRRVDAHLKRLQPVGSSTGP
jgi:hypothetical protein